MKKRSTEKKRKEKNMFFRVKTLFIIGERTLRCHMFFRFCVTRNIYAQGNSEFIKTMKNKCENLDVLNAT